MKPFKSSKFNRRESGDKNFSRSNSHGKREFVEFDKDSRGSKPSRGFNRSGSKPGFELHEAICDKCGKKCEVPFKPTGNKPVYCRSCYKMNELPESERFEGKSNDRYESRNHSDIKPSNDELEKINRKLDKIMKALKIG